MRTITCLLTILLWGVSATALAGITNTRVTNVTEDTAVIEWDTNTHATTELLFGPRIDGTCSLEQLPRLNVPDSTVHVYPVSGLEPGTTYCAEAMSKDPMTNQYLPCDDGSSPLDFTTQLQFEQVEIDIKPRSCPNRFTITSKGVLSVTILGTEDFDVTTIDPATIKIAREGIDDKVSPLRWAHEDVATPFEGELCECHDLNGDGYLDLKLKFKRKEVAQTLKLWEELGQEIPLTITGNLLEVHGGTSISGQDCVLVKPRVEGKAKLEPIDESGVYGKARLVTRKNGTTKVVLKSFTGLTPGETYTAHIRSGSCDGASLFNLNDVIVDAEGIGRSVTIVGATIDFDDWWIEVDGLTCGEVKFVRN